MKAEHLSGRTLDEWVWRAEGGSASEEPPRYSTSWTEAGAIIERVKITSNYHDNIDEKTRQWIGERWYCRVRDVEFKGHPRCSGETLIVAAMRAYVAYTFGVDLERAK